VGYIVLVIAYQVWIISLDAIAKELKKKLDQKMSLLERLMLGKIVIIVTPRFVES
jgi:hypothetical protein